MIILDTNVLSAMMPVPADQMLLRWLDSLPRASVWTTSINVFEVRFCLATMTAGKRQRALEGGFQRVLMEALQNRVLDFDAAAASEAALLAARRRRSGRPVGDRDTQIAGIALARRAAIATRDARDFEDVGVAILDPWKD